ncbi:3-oxoadipate enol-lactonase [Streptomyces sp. 796.1]|uniref:bifunctional 3-oxoadipate enol-lactonase/4-carboxymuconolactone decarboxylase PcaDC n=1 Tax=Streptomyces sp. 796.1 TaxID=3163029 RepID=UPI0039C9B0EE
MTTSLHYRIDGPDDAPALLLGPSLGTSLSVWDPQVAELAREFRVVRWDLPGHGGSPADALPADPTLSELAGQVLGVADALGIDAFAYAGVSLGGAVGIQLAAHHPQRVRSLALVCTSARFGPPEPWWERARAVREQGVDALADGAPGRWFTPAFAAGGQPAVAALVADHRAADPGAYAACCDLLATLDLRAELARVTAPTLVIGGREDVATPPSHARALADGIAGASLVEVARAGHLAGVEQPAAVLVALRTHLYASASSSAAAGELDTCGRFSRSAAMAVRRAVLGDAHVDRAVAGTTAFTARFQDFITRYAWGEIWTSEVLDRRTRSCITLTALVAGGHDEELAMHVRAALRNGLTPEEIGEVLLQSAVYVGVPAANSAFKVADRVLREVAAGSDGEAEPDSRAGSDGELGSAAPTAPGRPSMTGEDKETP